MGSRAGRRKQSGESDMTRTAHQRVAILAAMLAIALPISLVGCAATREGKAVLDFSGPPSGIYPARLVVLDGTFINVDMNVRTRFWVEPGTHEILVDAGILGLTTAPDRSAGTDPGRTTIEVEAGKRYRIGAQLINDRGDWETVIWKVEDVKD